MAVASAAFVLTVACWGTPEVAGPTPRDTECRDLTGAEAGASVRLDDFEFSPECFVVRSGQGLSLSNVGDELHNFTISGTQIDLDTAPRAETNTEAVGGVVEPGTHRFFCKYHEERGMTGEVRVVT